MQENKKKMISLGIAILVLLFIVVGATYAYFAAQIDSGSSTDVNITAESVDSLTFTTGDPISFSISQENLKQGGTDRSGSTTATASLIAGKDSSASYKYYVYLDITSNEFEYTTEDKKPELILKVTGANNTEVTAIDGLTYNSTLKGFDITTKNGLIKIAEEYNIATTSNLNQTWVVEIIFKNLDTNQVKNAEKSFKAELKIQSNKMAETIADVCSSGDNLAECVKTLENASTYSVSRILHHDASLKNGANDGSYRYSGGDYRVITDNLNRYAPIRGTLIKRYGVLEGEDYLLDARYWNDTSDYESYYYVLFYDKGKTKYDTFEEALAKTISDGYVEKTPSIHNYVCFGSEENPCPENNLYQIIGVFGDKVKLIKKTAAKEDLLGKDGEYAGGKYRLNSEVTDPRSNDWADSKLNTINLNTNYLNNIGTNWSEMINNYTWNVGGLNKTSLDLGSAKNVFDLELGECANCTGKNIKFTDKIGLMYVSDYLYAQDPIYWQTDLANKTIDSNWLFNFEYDSVLTISKYSGNNTFTNTINEYGGTGPELMFGLGFLIKPSFYLEASVKFVSGTGTESNPYRISK